MIRTYLEPPIGLLENILKRIRKEERLLVLKRIIIFSITLIASCFGFLPTLKVLLSDFNQSGFLRFSSLIFSDFSVVILYWRNFAIILLETIPAISLALFLVVLLAFLQSAKYLAKDLKIIIKTTILS